MLREATVMGCQVPSCVHFSYSWSRQNASDNVYLQMPYLYHQLYACSVLSHCPDKTAICFFIFMKSIDSSTEFEFGE